MAFTKTQILNFLENKKNTQPHNLTTPSESSIKYYTIGALKILVEKDFITLAEIQAEFPELA